MCCDPSICPQLIPCHILSNVTHQKPRDFIHWNIVNLALTGSAWFGCRNVGKKVTAVDVYSNILYFLEILPLYKVWEYYNQFDSMESLSILLICQNATLRVCGLWIKIYYALCSKTYSIFASLLCAADYRRAARGARICETRLLAPNFSNLPNHKAFRSDRSHPRPLSQRNKPMSEIS